MKAFMVLMLLQVSVSSRNVSPARIAITLVHFLALIDAKMHSEGMICRNHRKPKENEGFGACLGLPWLDLVTFGGA